MESPSGPFGRSKDYGKRKGRKPIASGRCCWVSVCLVDNANIPRAGSRGKGELFYASPVWELTNVAKLG